MGNFVSYVGDLVLLG